MSDLNLKPYDPLYPMRIHPYEELLKDQNASVIDKINSIIDYLNSVGKLTNDVVKNWNTVYNWTMNDGLKTGINNKLEDMLAKGEFDTIINTVVTKIGDITTLTTTDKTNLTKAINEIVSKIGDLTTLTTPQKDTIVHSINSLQSEVTTNTNAISTNTANIATNTTNIASNASQMADMTTNVKKFGAKGDGVADDSVSFQNAINAASSNGIKKISARGTYFINSTVNLASDIDYDFRGATFIGGANVGSYMFLGTNVSNINVIAGSHKIDGRSPTTTIPTGIYSSYTAFHFNGCTNVHVERSNFNNLWTCVNFYNCTDCDTVRCFTKDCDASFAANATTATVRNIAFNFNIIKGGGDDGIAFLSNSAFDIENCEAIGNQIDKVTRADGKLDGSVVAAVGIRAFGYSTGYAKFITIKGNQFKDMVTHAILLGRSKFSILSENIVNGFAKMSSAAIQVGTSTSDINTGHTISKNTITGAYVDSKAMVLYGTTNSLIEGNKSSGFGIGGEGLLYLYNSPSNTVKNNKFENTKAYSIQLYDSGSNNNEIEGNDVSVYAGLPIAIATGVTGTKIKNNVGYSNQNSGTIDIPSNVTSQVVSHGLFNLGNIKVSITPKNNLGNITKYWISAISDTSFTITFDQVASSLNPSFDWFVDQE